jgi:PAS domain-containing protein
LHRSVAPVLPLSSGVDMEARLSFAEFLLANTDLQASARHGVEWLAAHAGVEHAIVAISEPGNPNLQLMAERGVSADVVAEFAVSREEGGHPLVRALDSAEPQYFESSPNFRSPIEAPRFHVVPLRSDLEPVSYGILIASAEGPAINADVLWVSRMLGKQVGRLLGRQTLAETRFGQERMLLYSIINAVTDPILLTDTEGKLIIANTHAEKLFAAPEDASEGWRRAVSLNNMLFSAALSRAAVHEAAGQEPRELVLVDPSDGSDLMFEVLSTVV